jgi:FkbM family methyltransferase
VKTSLLKRLAWKTPPGVRHSLRKYHFMWEAARGRLLSGEPEFELLPKLLSAGDWAIDVGANVGAYTLRMSHIVGPAGRVIAFEPVPSTFEILAANCRFARHQNCTLLNAAASDGTALVTLSVPQFDDGSPNFYQASVQRNGGGYGALALSIDALALHHRVALVKVDAEGHDPTVLHGMQRLLLRDHPILIVESSDAPLVSWLAAMGYRAEHIDGSSNVIYRADSATLPSSRPADGSIALNPA